MVPLAGVALPGRNQRDVHATAARVVARVRLGDARPSRDTRLLIRAAGTVADAVGVLEPQFAVAPDAEHDPALAGQADYRERHARKPGCY